MSKIRRDLEQLQNLYANISGADWDFKNRKSNWSTTSPAMLDKNGELLSTNKKIRCLMFI